MKSQQGFSLIEMAFVLVIVTLLLGGLLVPFATQVEQKRIAETQKAMDEIKEALLGYAVANGRLPCPVTGLPPMSGDAPAPPCANVAGFLPYSTLGVSRADAWGRLYRYAVSANFTTTTAFALPTYNSSGICLTSCATIVVKTRDSSVGATALTNGAVAVVISFGKNGYGGYSADGYPVAPLTDTTSDEYANATLGSPFFSRTQTGPRPSCKDGTANPCEFDDLLTWLSPNVLFNRMVAAGKLP